MDIFDRIKNMKILLVDDDEWIRDSLSLFFEAEGCNLLTFETAEEAMEAVKQQVYDIVISDYKLPRMDGLEFLRRVKEKQPDAFEILITDYANCDILEKAKKRGVIIRIATQINEDNKEIAKEIAKVAEIRIIPKMRARFAIVDGQQLLFMVLDDEKVHHNADVAIGLSTDFFASAMEQLFEAAWKRFKGM